MIGAKACHKVNWFIRDYDKTGYLVLFGPEKCDAIFDKIRYLIGLENVITYVDSFNYAKIKIDSDLLSRKNIGDA